MHLDSSSRARAAGLAAVLAGGLLLAALTQAQTPAPATAAPAAAGQSRQPIYSTPEAASEALLKAVQSQSHGAVELILGDSDLGYTEVPEESREEREQFAAKYQQMHRLVHRTDGSVVLHIGAENWPFPVPLVAGPGGWRFDPAAGLREVVFRRIGENELTAIEVCHALVAAHDQPDRTAAKNGEDEEQGLLTKVLATTQPGQQAVRFHGYEYRVLPGQGFTAVAYPAEYRSSGVMTFVVNQDGVVYQKDLGRHTQQAAQHIKTFHPDATWKQAETGTEEAGTQPH